MPKYDWDQLDPDSVGEDIPNEVEYLAEPRLRTCTACQGSGTANGTDCQAADCEDGVLMPPYARFEKERVYRGMVPKFHKHPWVVTIDDVEYAAYDSRDAAMDAVKLWLGYTDGLGRLVANRERCTWPAVEGRVVRVVCNKDAAS